MTPQEPPLAREAIELAVKDARRIIDGPYVEPAPGAIHRVARALIALAEENERLSKDATAEAMLEMEFPDRDDPRATSPIDPVERRAERARKATALIKHLKEFAFKPAVAMVEEQQDIAITAINRAEAAESRAAQAEAENAVMVEALGKILGNMQTIPETLMDPVLGPAYIVHGITINRARDAIAHTTDGARRLLDVVEAALKGKYLMTESGPSPLMPRIVIGFHNNDDVNKFVDALAALSRHGNPEDPK